jgi:hypothetical protein
VGILSGIVTISWTAALDSLGHKITYAIFYSLDGNTWISLSSGITNTTYNWDTRNLETDESTYVIKIVATCSEGFTVEVVSGHKSTQTPFDPSIFSLIFIFFGLPLIAIFGFFFWRETKKRKPFEHYAQMRPSIIEEPAKHERISPIEAKLATEVPSRRIEPEVEKPKEFVPIIIPKMEPTKEAPPTAPAIDLVSEEKRALFSSVQYRVQDLAYEQSDTGLLVRLIPYSGLMKEIKVEFDNCQILMSGCLKRDNLPKVTLELKTRGEPRGPSWGDPWRDITMSGDKNVIAGIKLRSEISNSLNSLDTALVKVISPVEGEIHIKITCNETSEALKQAYSLITALQSFFEISFY